MAEYIERETLLEYLDVMVSALSFPLSELGEEEKAHIKGFKEARSVVEQFPTADAATVKHGKWLHTDYALHWTAKDECSECTYHALDRDDLSHYNYCPNCECRMEGDAD